VELSSPRDRFRVFSPSSFIADLSEGRFRLLVWAFNTGITADCSVLFSGISPLVVRGRDLLRQLSGLSAAGMTFHVPRGQNCQPGETETVEGHEMDE
jgi:hypothetical protein